MVNLKLNDIFLEVVWYRDNQLAPQLEIPYDVKSKSVGIKHIAFYVDDINEAFEDLRQKGLVDDTIEIHQSRSGPLYFFVKDPDGVWVEFIHDNRDH